MSQTVIRGTQILDNTVQRQDLDTSTVGQAVVTKIVQGSGISLSSTGADSGTGDVTVSSPDVVSTDAGNIAVLGSDNHILVPQSQIWSARLRSFNAIGNPTFEVDQRYVGSAITLSGNISIQDRWLGRKAGATMVATAQQLVTSVPVPGTNSFFISQNLLRIRLVTPQSVLAAGDGLQIRQFIEGPRLRELLGDVTSISLLVRPNVALKFGVILQDSVTAYSLSKLVSVPANQWTLVQLPNIPLWTASGTFPITPGSNGYILWVSLACGSTNLSPANDVWQAGNFFGAAGQDNFAASPNNSVFDIAFIQHEPGALCTTPIDKPFTQNYDDCLRYYQKSYDYDILPGAVSAPGLAILSQISTTQIAGSIRFHKPLAKTPTMTAYNHTTGAINSIFHTSSSSFAVTSFSNPGKSGIYAVNTATMPAVVAGASGYLHYTADTGW